MSDRLEELNRKLRGEGRDNKVTLQEKVSLKEEHRRLYDKYFVHEGNFETVCTVLGAGFSYTTLRKIIGGSSVKGVTMAEFVEKLEAYDDAMSLAQVVERDGFQISLELISRLKGALRAHAAAWGTFMATHIYRKDDQVWFGLSSGMDLTDHIKLAEKFDSDVALELKWSKDHYKLHKQLVALWSDRISLILLGSDMRGGRKAVF